MEDQTISVYFDGGSRGNPGPAGIGIVLRPGDGTSLVTLGRYIGKATNNVAEYRALIAGLQEARKLGAGRVIVYGDSELIVRQMLGEYRVRHPDMRQLYEQAQALMKEFADAKLVHNLREKNVLADRLANLAMDRRADVTEVDEDPLEAPAPVESKAGDIHVCPRCGCRVQIKAPSAVRPHQLKPFVCQCGMPMHRPQKGERGD